MPRSGPSRAPRTGHEVRRTRTPWGTISRETVVDAAIKAVTSGNYEDMSIRSLAADLGVAPMTLYRHVRDKDDLLDEVVDRLLARVWKPTVSRSDWRAWIIQAADKLRRFLVTSPVALYVYLRRPVVTPTAIRRMTAMLAVLRQGIGDEEKARRAYAVIHAYTLGFAALEVARSGWSSAETTVDEVTREVAAFISPRQFRDGLGYLLDGIAG